MISRLLYRDRDMLKRRALLLVLCCVAAWIVLVNFRWEFIPGTSSPFWALPLWAKGGGLAILTLGLFGLFRLGGRFIRDARRMYAMSTPVRSSQEGVRWYRYLNPVGPFYNLLLHRDLLGQFVRREIQGRYRGSYLGIVWSMVTPLLMLIIYTFVFSVVFKARWRLEGNANPGEFAVTLFAGLIAFNVFAECVNRAPMLIVASPNYVKKVVFPLEVLPASVLGSALFHGLLSTAILMAGELLILGAISPSVLLLPLAALPLIGVCLGLGWFLASFGVYVRDVSYAVSLATQGLFFLTPIFYPLDAVPQDFRPILRLNPMTDVVDGFRRVLVWSQPLDWPIWLTMTALSGVVCLLGYAWFMKTKVGFADVI